MPPWFPFRSRTRYGASEGINEAWLVRCAAIGKSNADHRYMIANEWIAANLAQFLRLPIPPFSLLRKKTGNTAMFASYSFEGDTAPSDIRPDVCFHAHPDLCTGILVFDVLIANCDRHRGNVKVDRPAAPSRVHIIDHDHALLYVMPDDGVRRLHDVADRLGITGGSVSGHNRHIFLDVIDTAEHFFKWTSRVREIPVWFLEEACDAISGVGIRKRELDAVKSFLKARRDNIGSLILGNKSEFARISDWPVIL